MAIHRLLIVDDEEAVRQSYFTILGTNQNASQLDLMATALSDEESFGEGMLGNHSDAPLTDEIMDLEGYELSEASQGMDAVKLVEASLLENRPFSLIFLDIRRPLGISGMETAKRIRALDAYVEIVIMTAYSDDPLEEMVEEVGNPERLLYFHKPFDPRQIQQLAISLTQRWQLNFQLRTQND